MKKLFTFMFLAAICIVATPLYMYAQDTASAVTSGGTDAISFIVGWLGVKWPIVGTIGTVLFLFSEALALIPAVKANSVYQLITGLLKKAFGK